MRISAASGAETDSGHSVGLRRVDGEQSAAHPDLGDDGPRPLPRVVHPFPLPGPRKTPARYLGPRRYPPRLGSERVCLNAWTSTRASSSRATARSHLCRWAVSPTTRCSSATSNLVSATVARNFKTVTPSLLASRRVWRTARLALFNSCPTPNPSRVGSTEFIVLRSRTLTPEFVYLLARSDEFRENAIKSMSGASGRQRVQERCFEDFKIVHPPRDLLDRFSLIAAPSFRLIHKLHLQTQNLRRTRDLLLPRLLSGQISVKTG